MVLNNHGCENVIEWKKLTWWSWWSQWKHAIVRATVLSWLCLLPSSIHILICLSAEKPGNNERKMWIIKVTVMPRHILVLKLKYTGFPVSSCPCDTDKPCASLDPGFYPLPWSRCGWDLAVLMTGGTHLCKLSVSHNGLLGLNSKSSHYDFASLVLPWY